MTPDVLDAHQRVLTVATPDALERELVIELRLRVASESRAKLGHGKSMQPRSFRRGEKPTVTATADDEKDEDLSAEPPPLEHPPPPKSRFSFLA